MEIVQVVGSLRDRINSRIGEADRSLGLEGSGCIGEREDPGPLGRARAGASHDVESCCGRTERRGEH